ncbi:MAG TPA: hypothetical protein VFD60_03330, partial [Nitrososphaeraceae archaeon]|nr:hypothetical protein [Nitrososphaeraceae archaeon]
YIDSCVIVIRRRRNSLIISYGSDLAGAVTSLLNHSTQRTIYEGIFCFNYSVAYHCLTSFCLSLDKP